VPAPDNTDYSLITESPGLKASKEQVERLYQRYRFARDLCAGKDILEVACGSGIGLGYLAESAASVVAGDIDSHNLSSAQSLYGDKPGIMLKLLDAQNLRIESGSIDLVILFEAIYYLWVPEKFVSEARRVLKEGGVLLMSTVNRDWDDFHPSPFTFGYFSVPELHDLLKSSFNHIELFGGKPVSLVKRAAVGLNLIPGSLKGRTYLKRIFMGKLTPLPRQLRDDMVPYEPPVSIPPVENKDYKIIYALAKK
jgi:SAM-dependent methyltransferase